MNKTKILDKRLFDADNADTSKSASTHLPDTLQDTHHLKAVPKTQDKMDAVPNIASQEKTMTKTQDAPQGFGKRLQEARQKANLSTKDVANSLHLLNRHIVAMEAEAFGDLPEFAFAKGFVNNYAKALKLDADAIVQDFTARYPQALRNTTPTPKNDRRPMPKLSRGRSQGIRLNPWLILGAIALVAMVIFLLQMIAQTSADDAPTPTVLPLNATELAQGALVGPLATDSQLTLTIQNQTGVQVIDGAGSILMQGIQTPGHIGLTGEAPLSVVIEDAGAVLVQYAGQDIDLAPHTTDNRAVLSLPLE